MAKLSPEEKLKRLEERRRIRWEETHLIINGIDHKKCGICSEYLPMEENFYKKKNGIDGYDTYCKECAKKKSWDWQKDNYERHKERMHFYIKNKEWRINHGRKNSKRQQESGYTKEWQRNNKDKLRKQREYRKQYKDHQISNEEWENCKNYFNYRCAYCGMKIEDHYILHHGKTILGDFHKDHADHKGANDLSNCIPACKSCNCSKHDKPLENWYMENNELWCPVFDVSRLETIYKWLHEDYKNYIEAME